MTNLNTAFDVAEKYLDIPKMLDAEGKFCVCVCVFDDDALCFFLHIGSFPKQHVFFNLGWSKTILFFLTKKVSFPAQETAPQLSCRWLVTFTLSLQKPLSLLVNLPYWSPKHWSACFCRIMAGSSVFTCLSPSHHHQSARPSCSSVCVETAKVCVWRLWSADYLSGSQAFRPGTKTCFHANRPPRR